MKVRDIVLLIIQCYGGRLPGRTLLQKVAYFVCEKLKVDPGFRAHYYGPYSADVDRALGELKSLGFVTEDALAWGISERFGELKRFDYRLSPDGETLLAELRRRDSVGCERIEALVDEIRKIVGTDYRELSLAAKTYFIVKRQNRPVTLSEVKTEAQKLDWNLSPESLNKAARLLQQLNLVS
jgi:uncharacterized protein YwgA